jgi:hypothetical protein
MLSPQSPAQEIVRVMSFYRRKASGLAQAALLGANTFREWEHYPRHDARDHAHGTEFYYHAHAANERLRHEHGHFHVFSRPEANGSFVHLVGISLDPHGLPLRLFLTNRWVTGESWVSAASARQHIRRFCFKGRGPLAPLGDWVTSMVHLYRHDIEALHDARDQWTKMRSPQFPSREALLESRRYQVIAQRRVQLLQRLAQEIAD